MTVAVSSGAWTDDLGRYLNRVILPISTKIICGGRKDFVESLRAWSARTAWSLDPLRPFEEFSPMRQDGEPPHCWKNRDRRIVQAAGLVVILPGRAGSALLEVAREEGRLILDLRAPDILRIDRGADHLLAARVDPFSESAESLARLWLSFDTLCTP